ncbi:MAG: hypothetical protein ABIO45_00020 [Burkholderiaceae bacterium]
MKITTGGLDLAKNVFQVHRVNERGAAALRKQLKPGILPAPASSMICRRNSARYGGRGAGIADSFRCSR